MRVDSFYQEYMTAVDWQGITNYFHMLRSGHISEYFLHYRNLYRHLRMERLGPLGTFGTPSSILYLSLEAQVTYVLIATRSLKSFGH